MAAGIFLLKMRLNLSDAWLLIIGLGSTFGSYVVLSFAVNTFLMYLEATIAAFQVFNRYLIFNKN